MTTRRTLEALGLDPRPGETYPAWAARFDTAAFPAPVSLARLTGEYRALRAAGHPHEPAVAEVARHHGADPDHLDRLIRNRKDQP